MSHSTVQLLAGSTPRSDPAGHDFITTKPACIQTAHPTEELSAYLLMSAP